MGVQRHNVPQFKGLIKFYLDWESTTAWHHFYYGSRPHEKSHFTPINPLCPFCFLGLEGNRKIVKNPDRKIVKNPDRKIVKKPHRKIVKLFADKFVGSWPYSKIVKKVQSHTGKLSKTSQMIFTGKISICKPWQR